MEKDRFLRTGAAPQSGSAGSAALESVGFARAGRACTDVQRRDCYIFAGSAGTGRPENRVDFKEISLRAVSLRHSLIP